MAIDQSRGEVQQKMFDSPEAQQKFAERLGRTEAAIALQEPDQIPIMPCIVSIAQRYNGSCYEDLFYNYERAGEAALKFYAEYQPDAHNFSGFTSGKANELAGSSMIDWPGRPGSIVDRFSSHQVIEHEYLLPEEYPELINNFDGFMLRKYIPRAFPKLAALSKVSCNPAIVLNTGFLRNFYDPEVLKAYELLGEIAKYDAEAAEATAKYQAKLTAMGFPGAMSGICEAPFDILGDYFRGTMGMLNDQIEYEDEIEQVCEMFANQQIAALQRFRNLDIPVKRVFFPLHKGMDGFMSPRQYEKLYWKPLKKLIMALIEMGVTPYIYTEGRYNTRLEQLTDVPKGKVLYHFENVDMAEAKRIVGGVACISGNLPIQLLEFGKKEQVVDYCKYLIDTCAPGGGYIFDTDGSIENAKRENLDAMFDTLRTYGRK